MIEDEHRMTVRDFINSGDTYFWFCRDEACKAEHGDIMEPIDMLRFAEKFGMDHGAFAHDILPLMHCTRCNGKSLGLIRQPEGH